MITKRKTIPFRVRNSRIQGRGIFATEQIRKGRRLIEYVGEIIDREEEVRRYDEDKMDRHHTFLFEVEHDITIDGAVGGNSSRFINHSCDPNCEAVNEDGRIFIWALKSIKPGEELTYDYAYGADGRITKRLMEKYVCYCGTENCRGTILKLNKRNGNIKNGRPKTGHRRSGAGLNGRKK
ncbi:MAG: SET domain-containing protein-lysine N-methyltransferase [candidate division Zixibacteria bacterium]|nr:SET domain-containing protein-lysine N-methyltransferase [candidate division Zixibacteria bacterium]